MNETRPERKSLRRLRRTCRMAMTFCMGMMLGAAWLTYGSVREHLQLIIIAGAGAMLLGAAGGVWDGGAA